MFKHRIIKPIVNIPHDINEVVSVVKEKDGVQHVSFISQSCEVTQKSLPNPDDYKLSRLLASGAVLQPVSPHILDTPPTDAFISSLEAKLTPPSGSAVDQPSNV